ncbi:MAG: ATP-dependent RecD-like DNA helicase [Holdemanella sp.]|nr:ATP-dependent RecD-like DNA helicase [Holdemanella sp.]
MEVLKARLDYIVFENKQSHYVVGSFSALDTYLHFTGAGNMNDAKEDMEYELEGEFVTHPKFGQQFKIISARFILPTSEKQIIRFLTGDTFPTIGKKTATQIYEALGDDCLEAIAKDSSILYQIPGLNQKKIDIIQDGIQEYSGFNEVYVKLLKMGLSDNKITLLQNQYEDVMEVIEKNCYQPYYEIYGFGYASANKLADGFGIDPMDDRRMDAFIYEECRKISMDTGNTYLTWATLIENIYGLSIQQIQDCITRLNNQSYLFVENDRIYPFGLYDDEIVIAKELNNHIYEVDQMDSDLLMESIKEVEFTYNIEYDIKQKEAISAFFNTSLSIINGGPGTGKTTIVKGILHIIKHILPECRVQLCAPTGRASKRLAQLSDCDSRTIHSLLLWNLDDNSFGKGKEDPLEIDVLIVDEFSMVDTHLFAQLLKATPPNCRILLIGDEDQLESVGPGKVFEDIIESQICPVVHLEKIFRQANGSGIVSLAQNIRMEQPCEFDDGVTFLERQSQEILSTIESLARNYDIEDMQILAPMHKGLTGIHAINGMMQELFNPPSRKKKQLKIGNTIFREHDKVMLLKNMPDDDVYNGDIGMISAISKEDGNDVIEVDFGDRYVYFQTDFLYYLTHAYCISVHKSQGSEYNTVFMIVDAGATYMLEKRLLYTGISRAKKELYIIGNKPLFEKQVKLKQKRIRQTTLKNRIEEYKGGIYYD